MIGAAATVAGLTLLYALALNSFAPWDLAAGTVLAVVMTWWLGHGRAAERPEGRVNWLRRVWALVPFALAIVRDVTKGTWQVASVSLRLRPIPTSGIVGVPIGNRTRRGVMVAALVTTLSPGSVFLDVDWARGRMFYHVLDASDPEEVRRQFEEFYQRYQRPVFP